MSAVDQRKAPFPWFGGKRHAAPHVWAALGDVPHYVDPFCGSLAVLLMRPHKVNRTYFSETVNDLDGLLVNAWRSIAAHPDAVADAASWPVSEVDLMARHLALVAWREEGTARMRADPTWSDPVMAGWWLWGQSSWIGSGWCSGRGPWRVDPATGSVVRSPSGRVNGKLPHLADDGRGVNRPQLREEGVDSALPHLSSDGRGVNRPQLREEGVDSKRPQLGSSRGVLHPSLRDPGCGDEPDWHPMTMPELRSWMRYLSARLRHVRILQGDWRRALTDGAAKTLPVRQGQGPAGIFLDPPYGGGVRAAGLYSIDDHDIAHDVRQWCTSHGDDPALRIVLAGFDTEHTELEGIGWRAVEWYAAGYLRGGMANTGSNGHQQQRERLWLSPHCLTPAEDPQLAMFA